MTAAQLPLDGRLFEDLRNAVRPGSGAATETFLESVDNWQSAAYRSLLDTYRDDIYSKLLAVKAANLVVRRFELQRRRRVLLTRPSQLTVNPTNACQLACPGCVHGEKWSATVPWPKNTLRLDRFAQFMSSFGPTGCATMLYNFGEPLLNKRFPSFVTLAKGYQSHVAASTNLSLPIDAEAIVRSGLDLLVISIDGTTQETYERYRINGRLDCVLENVRALVAARQRIGSDRPYLQWQFLTFEHNQHQLDEVFLMAKALGIDSVRVLRAAEWGWDEGPAWRETLVGLQIPLLKRRLQPVTTSREGEHRFRPLPREIDLETWRSSMLTEEVSKGVEAAFQASWIGRFRATGVEEADRETSDTCSWLYDNITMDGAQRLMPCCLMPIPGAGQLVFGRFAPEEEATDFDFVNTKLAVLSRTAFADAAEYAAQTRPTPPDERSYCATCKQQPAVPFAWPFAQGRIWQMDAQHVLSRMSFEELTSV